MIALFLARFLQPVLIGTVVTLFVSTGVQTVRLSNLKATVAEQAQVIAKQAQAHAEQVAAAERLRADAEQKYRALEQRMTAQTQQHREEYEAAVEGGNRELARVLGRLRNAERTVAAATAAASRKPAEAAPAECRNYEAPASQLSDPDGSFLVRIAAEADDVVRQLQLCQRYVETVSLRPSGER